VPEHAATAATIFCEAEKPDITTIAIAIEGILTTIEFLSPLFNASNKWSFF
jgi:hypothetical protein